MAVCLPNAQRIQDVDKQRCGEIQGGGNRDKRVRNGVSKIRWKQFHLSPYAQTGLLGKEVDIRTTHTIFTSSSWHHR